MEAQHASTRHRRYGACRAHSVRGFRQRRDWLRIFIADGATRTSLLYQPNPESPLWSLLKSLSTVTRCIINRKGVPSVWKRVCPILIGMLPGIGIGALALTSLQPGCLTYVVILPLILLQAAGWRRPLPGETHSASIAARASLLPKVGFPARRILHMFPPLKSSQSSKRNQVVHDFPHRTWILAHDRLPMIRCWRLKGTASSLCLHTRQLASCQVPLGGALESVHAAVLARRRPSSNKAADVGMLTLS